MLLFLMQELKVRFLLESTTELRINRAAGLGGAVTIGKSSSAPPKTSSTTKKTTQSGKQQQNTNGKPPLQRADTLSTIVDVRRAPGSNEDYEGTEGIMRTAKSRALQRNLEMLEEENRLLEEADLLEQGLLNLSSCFNRANS